MPSDFTVGVQQQAGQLHAIDREQAPIEKHDAVPPGTSSQREALHGAPSGMCGWVHAGPDQLRSRAQPAAAREASLPPLFMAAHPQGSAVVEEVGAAPHRACTLPSASSAKPPQQRVRSVWQNFRVHRRLRCTARRRSRNPAWAVQGTAKVQAIDDQWPSPRRSASASSSNHGPLGAAADGPGSDDQTKGGFHRRAALHRLGAAASLQIAFD